MCVRHASIGVPLMLTAQDPQIADRHADPDRAVLEVPGLEDPLEHSVVRRELDREPLPEGGPPAFGYVTEQVQRVLGHQ